MPGSGTQTSSTPAAGGFCSLLICSDMRSAWNGGILLRSSPTEQLHRSRFKETQAAQPNRCLACSRRWSDSWRRSGKRLPHNHPRGGERQCGADRIDPRLAGTASSKRPNSGPLGRRGLGVVPGGAGQLRRVHYGPGHLRSSTRTGATPRGDPYIDRINAMPKYVASRSLTQTAWNPTLLSPTRPVRSPG